MARPPRDFSPAELALINEVGTEVFDHIATNSLGESQIGMSIALIPIFKILLQAPSKKHFDDGKAALIKAIETMYWPHV